MAKRTLSTLLTSGLVAVAFAATGLAPAAAVAAETIKIGSFLAATGPASFLGDPEVKTLKLYVEKINSEGGVLGRKLKLVIYDTGTNPKKAVTFGGDQPPPIVDPLRMKEPCLCSLNIQEPSVGVEILALRGTRNDSENQAQYEKTDRS